MDTNHNLFEEKGEPKRYRTEVLPLTSLSNALPLGHTGSQRLAPSKPTVLVILLWTRWLSRNMIFLGLIKNETVTDPCDFSLCSKSTEKRSHQHPPKINASVVPETISFGASCVTGMSLSRSTEMQQIL